MKPLKDMTKWELLDHIDRTLGSFRAIAECMEMLARESKDFEYKNKTMDRADVWHRAFQLLQTGQLP